MKALVSAQGSDFVNAIHLQVYSGGTGNLNLVDKWQSGFNAAGGKALMIPGLATNQTQAGPWWDGKTKAMGQNVLVTPNVAMYEGADWDNYLYTQNFPTIDAAPGCPNCAIFLFYCRGPMGLQMAILQTGRRCFLPVRRGGVRPAMRRLDLGVP